LKRSEFLSDDFGFFVNDALGVLVEVAYAIIFLIPSSKL